MENNAKVEVTALKNIEGKTMFYVSIMKGNETNRVNVQIGEKNYARLYAMLAPAVAETGTETTGKKSK